MSNSHPSVLIVDDEKNARRVLSAILKEVPFEVYEAADVPEAKEIVGSERIDAVITDLKMPGEDGLQLFYYLKESHPDIPVIFLTAFGTVESAVSAMNEGAFFYFVKPPDYAKLKAIVAKATEQKRMRDEISSLKRRLESAYGLTNIIGKSPGMVEVFNMVEAIKDSSITVLITGETGTGKDLLANAIHYTSKRHFRPFVAVNCAAFPRELMESEFFGHEKGAFTGAVARRIGKFEEAHTGTLFLDEIAELELPLQAKILRAIQEKEIERLGSNQKIKVDVRLIASTNRDLSEAVREGKFRPDLYYRLNVVEIKLPPLRDRKSDIPLLVEHFIDRFSQQEGKGIDGVTDSVMNAFMAYDWPGNLRELKNVLQRAVVLTTGGKIDLKDIPHEIAARSGHKAPASGGLKSLKEIEIESVIQTMKACRGNKSKAAKVLGITRKALYSRLKEIEAMGAELKFD